MPNSCVFLKKMGKKFALLKVIAIFTTNNGAKYYGSTIFESGQGSHVVE